MEATKRPDGFGRVGGKGKVHGVFKGKKGTDVEGHTFRMCYGRGDPKIDRRLTVKDVNCTKCMKKLKKAGLLHEYGGIGGRVAGARHPFKIPQPQVRTRKDMTPEMVEKAKRRIETRAKTREYMRQVALGEARRKLSTLDV